MKALNIARVGAVIAAASLTLSGCDQSKNETTAANGQKLNSVTQAVEGALSDNVNSEKEMERLSASTFQDARLYCLGMILFAQKNNNVTPTNLDQTLPYLRDTGSPSGTNRFELLYQGRIDQLKDFANTIVIRSEPWQLKDGQWTRIYGFADGHCERHSEPQKDFGAWEKPRLAAAKDS